MTLISSQVKQKLIKEADGFVLVRKVQENLPESSAFSRGKLSKLSETVGRCSPPGPYARGKCSSIALMMSQHPIKVSLTHITICATPAMSSSG